MDASVGVALAVAAHEHHAITAAATALLDDLAAQRIAGGSVYDALVGATAAEHLVALATRDRRALDTCRALGVHVELLS
ncbi:MAG: hypothetical protein M3P44_07450 [Actinomycetota bacterium]|nr:hypothetical protein [Actinomycetota bacterium]